MTGNFDVADAFVFCLLDLAAPDFSVLLCFFGFELSRLPRDVLERDVFDLVFLT